MFTTLRKKLKSVFEAYGDESSRDTFKGELNYESGKIFYILCLVILFWPFYIPFYLSIHENPAVSKGCIIVFTVISFTTVALKFTRILRNHSGLIIAIVISTFLASTAVLFASSTENIALHVSCYGLAIMIPVLVPLSFRFKVIAIVSSIVLLFTAGIFFGVDWSDPTTQFVFFDTLVRVGVALLFSWNMRIIRFDAWKDKQNLKHMIEENEKNLKRISDLAAKAEALSRTKSDFLARMSHEIRTPMNAIIGMTELALRETRVDVIREHNLTIKRASESLLSLINDILDFSKIEAGKLEIVTKEYNVPALLDDIINIIKMRVSKTPLLFTVNVDHTIPLRLFGDENRIRQILINLLNNAVKYTEAGYISLLVYGKPTDDNNFELIIEVKDTGIGIKPEDIDKLFLDFTQVDLASRENVEGVGLGLAISNSLAAAMGGNISVASEYGVGSTFTVILPQKYDSREPLCNVEKPESKRILIYEPREAYADSVAFAIDNLGADYTLVYDEAELREAFIARGGKEALREGERPYDFLFISFELFAENEEIIYSLGGDVEIVILSDLDDFIPAEDINVLALPIYCVAVADILNGSGEEVPEESGARESGIGFTAPSAKVLIVDDLMTNLRVAKGLLDPYKMNVELCRSGAEAIEAVKSAASSAQSAASGGAGGYDLIFMDHMMPKMGGIEAVSIIRGLEEDGLYDKPVPIVALTANAVSGMREMFLEHGFNDFISKPVDVAKLNTVLEKWIPKDKQVR